MGLEYVVPSESVSFLSCAGAESLVEQFSRPVRMGFM